VNETKTRASIKKINHHKTASYAKRRFKVKGWGKKRLKKLPKNHDSVAAPKGRWKGMKEDKFLGFGHGKFGEGVAKGVTSCLRDRGRQSTHRRTGGRVSKNGTKSKGENTKTSPTLVFEGGRGVESLIESRLQATAGTLLGTA